MSLEFPIDALFWKWCQSAYLSQRLKIISDFHFQEIKSIWRGRSIFFSWELGGRKKKLKKSEMSLLSRDIVEKVGDKILHEIMEKDHKKLFVNEILQKIPFLQKEVMCVYVIMCVYVCVSYKRYK